MVAPLSTWIRQRPLLAFYILAFAVTWLGWAPQAAYSHGLFPFDSPIFYILGGVGPMLAAFVVMRVLRGDRGDMDLLRPLWRWRVGAVWYLVALLANPAIALVASGITEGLDKGLERVVPSMALLPVFLTYMLAAVPEEVAWRGFVLPRLQARHGALVASLIIGVLAVVWHLPLLLVKGSVMSTYPLLPYFLYLIGLTVLYTSLYNASRGSLLLLVIFHAVSNTFGPFVPAQAAVTIVLAIIVLLAFGPASLAPRQGRQGRIVDEASEAIARPAPRSPSG